MMYFTYVIFQNAWTGPENDVLRSNIRNKRVSYVEEKRECFFQNYWMWLVQYYLGSIVRTRIYDVRVRVRVSYDDYKHQYNFFKKIFKKKKI